MKAEKVKFQVGDIVKLIDDPSCIRRISKVSQCGRKVSVTSLSNEWTHNLMPSYIYTLVDTHEHTHTKELSGSDADYYKLPKDAKDLMDLIEHRKMSFSEGNIFKAIWRLGGKPGVDKIYDLDKIIFFANRLKGEIENG
jgi:hypothetical protein